MNLRKVGMLTGSAPLATRRSELRSRPASAASSILLRHISNAKLGAAEIVPRYRWIAHSQLCGRARKATGDMT